MMVIFPLWGEVMGWGKKGVEVVKESLKSTWLTCYLQPVCQLCDNGAPKIPVRLSWLLENGKKHFDVLDTFSNKVAIITMPLF